MSNDRPGGVFIWYELATTDSAAALKFYSHVLGWTSSTMDSGGMSYTIVASNGVNVGGVMQLTPEMCDAHVPPHWAGYIGVADVDAKTAAVKAAGGSILRAPADIPGVGRFSVVADPHGASFIMMTPISKEPLPVVAPDAPGHVGWRELHAGNAEEAFAFYSAQFGWTKGMAVDMGPIGMYQTFATGGEATVGGMMNKMPEMPQPFWGFYFTVPVMSEGLERATSMGAKLLNGPHPVPGGSFIANLMDPQGAMFSLVSAKA